MDSVFLVRGQEFFQNIIRKPSLQFTYFILDRESLLKVLSPFSHCNARNLLCWKKNQCSLQNNQDIEYDNIIQASRLD